LGGQPLKLRSRFSDFEAAINKRDRTLLALQRWIDTKEEESTADKRRWSQIDAKAVPRGGNEHRDA
jgi:hypothetical protein